MIHGQIQQSTRIRGATAIVAPPAPVPAPKLHTAPTEPERRVPVLRLAAVVAAFFAFGAIDSIAGAVRDALGAGASPIAVSTAIGR